MKNTLHFLLSLILSAVFATLLFVLGLVTLGVHNNWMMLVGILTFLIFVICIPKIFTVFSKENS